MKQLFFGSVALLALAADGPAVAADMPVKSPVYKAAPVAVYNWSGFYAGLNAGYGWGDTSFNLTGDNDAGQGLVSITSTSAGSFRTSGFIGGGQLGYNWQFNRTWLAGLEADIDYSNIRGSESFAAAIFGFPFRIDADRRLQWLGTLRARLGVLPTERLLIFATGGLAYGQNKASASITNLSAFTLNVVGFLDGTSISCPSSNPNPCLAGGGSRTSAGWTVGGGLEYAFWNNVSLKAEYLYVNLGSSQTIHLTPVPPGSGTGSVAANFNDAEYHIVRGGINFKFDGGPVGKGPVVSRY